MKKGIAIGGNWLLDYVKVVDVYPEQDHLANILSQRQGNGGCAYTTLKDLAKLGAPFPLQGLGMVGEDAAGDWIVKDCRAHGIDMSRVKRTGKAPTSYTDVMTVAEGGRRTFFHNRGANALWSPDDVKIDGLTCRIFHLGYLLLLDRFDLPDERYGTVATRFLARLQERGIKTSIDVVSEDSRRYAKVVRPALRHVNYAILNEVEVGRTTGYELRRRDGSLDEKALRRSGETLFRLGVKDLVVVHFPEGGYARTADGREMLQPSVRLPKGYIKGTVGAGDAFAAGALLAIHEDAPMEQILEDGACVAAASLASETASDSIAALRKARALGRKFGFRKNG
ncbi:MAG: carbohydrate kinase family protein [Verrucomicrobiae bacterium]|nr:carbohydrate kinase family protein [Verrucomicrobiae bacterium]